MESVRPVTAITGSNKFRALAEFLNFRFSDAIKPVFVAWIVARRSRMSPRGRPPNSFRKRNVCLVRASRRRDLNVMGPQRAETAPISVVRQGPLTFPLATFAVAICNGSKTEGFRTLALCRCVGTGRGAGVRKPRKEETAGRKRRGLAGRELWGFWGRGRVAHVAAGVEGSRCYRQERTRRAFSGVRMRAAGVGAAAGESLRRS
jgi:hypothetical protein